MDMDQSRRQDFIITDKKSIVHDVTVLNQVSIGSDHRMVRALVVIDTEKERERLMMKKNRNKWNDPESPDRYKNMITQALHDNDNITDINVTNKIITDTLRLR